VLLLLSPARPSLGWTGGNRAFSGVRDVSILTACFSETDYGGVRFDYSPLAFIGIGVTHVSWWTHRRNAARWLRLGVLSPLFHQDDQISSFPAPLLERGKKSARKARKVTAYPEWSGAVKCEWRHTVMDPDLVVLSRWRLRFCWSWLNFVQDGVLGAYAMLSSPASVWSPGDLFVRLGLVVDWNSDRGAAPIFLCPTYALANVGHPSNFLWPLQRHRLRSYVRSKGRTFQSARLKIRIWTSLLIVRWSRPLACIRWMKSGVILKMRIWINSSSVGW
jgi:hypothetical protein